MLNYRETPVQELKDPLLEAANLKLLVKREDLNHSEVSGNKWWKLKYNLEKALSLGTRTLLTFGGAYSNHIVAAAAAAKEMGFESIGIIRGEETLPLNHTLTFAQNCGMQLHYETREAYRKKNELGFIDSLHKKFGDFYLIPEGGTNDLAIRGCVELAKKILTEIDFDVLCLPVGTGGTMAGMVSGFEGKKEVIGFSVLRGGEFLETEVRNLANNFSVKDFNNWRIETRFHFGGYGKWTPDLEDFIASQERKYRLPLDQIYTSKMMMGVFDMIKEGYFNRGSTVLVLHTGGLQGMIQ